MSVDYTVYTDTSRIQKIFAYSRIYQQELWEKHFIRRMIADNFTALLGLWISCRIRPGAWEAEDAGPRSAAKKKKKEDNSESVQGLVSYMMRYSCRPRWLKAG